MATPEAISAPKKCRLVDEPSASLPRMIQHRLALVVALAILPLGILAGCEAMTNMPFTPDPENASPGDGDYVTSEPFEVPEFDYVWDRAGRRLDAAGYGVDGSRTSRTKREIVSQWHTRLAPSRFAGTRMRAWVRFGDGGEGRQIVRVAIQVQRNEDIRDPTSSVLAQWKDEPADVERARLLAFQIESDFRARDP